MATDSTALVLSPDGGWRPSATRAEIVVRERRADSIYNAFTGLGGAGDKGQVGRPNPWHIPLTDQELENLHQYGGIARRLVDIVPARACRRGWTVPEIGSEDSRLQTWARVEDGMIWSRLYGGALGLLVTQDDVPAEWAGDPTGWLRQPLDPQRVGRLDAVQVFDALECWPSKWDTDVRSPGFRLPSEWLISTPEWRATVHASRVLHFRGAKRQPSRYRNGRTRMPDDSVLQAIWDDLRKLQETLQGGAILAHEIRESVLKIADYGAISTGDEAAALQSRLQLMSQGRSLLGMSILGPGDEFESRSNPPTGFDQLSAAAWEALAAVTGIPQVILMGSTPGGLNTDGGSSWEGFRQLVSTYQESHRHLLEQYYRVVYAQQDGPTGGREPDGWALTFAALDEPDEATVAETRAKVAATDVAMIDAGVYTEDDVRRSRFGPGGWSIDLLPVADADAEAEERAELTGAHFDAVLKAIADVAAGTSPRDAVAASLALLLEITLAEADALLGSAGQGFVPTPKVVVQQGPNATPRADAVPSDAVTVLIPAADPGLRAAVEVAIGQPLTVDGDPHVTVLYLGGGLSPEQVAEVVQIVGDLAGDLDPAAVLGCPTVRTLPSGPDGTPVVVEYGEAWTLAMWQEGLLRACAHLVTARQHPRYRPHLTLGYAADPLTPEAVAALLAIVPPEDTPDAPDLRVPLAEVQVTVGTLAVARFAVGAEPPEPGEPSPPSTE